MRITASLFHGIKMTAYHAPQLTYKILRLSQVLELTGLSKSSVYDMLDQKSPRHDSNFPKGVKLSERSVGWVEHEIQEWIKLKITKSRG